MTSSLGKSPGKSAESGKHLGAVSGKHDPRMSSDGEGNGRSSGGRSTGTPLHENASVHEMMSRYQELQKLYEDKAAEHEKLHTKVKKQKESYIRREVKYKSEISHIKDTLEKTVLCRGAEEVSLPKIREMHHRILSTLGEFQSRAQRTVEEHERDLSRQFRNKIIEIEERMAKDQTKEEDLAGVPKAWVERTSKLAKEVDKHKEQAVRLDRINEVLNRTIEKYRIECRAQEDDREFLVRQMVAIKKENARLRSEVSKISAGITAPHESLPVPAMRLGTAASDGALAVSSPERRAEQLRSRPLTAVSLQLRGETQRYAEVVGRLQRLLDSERKQAREARAAHTRLVQNRTELEEMLRECVAEIKEEAGLEPDARESLNKDLRERVLEMLLSQDRTITLLYGQPILAAGAEPAAAAQAMAAPPVPFPAGSPGAQQRAKGDYQQELLHVSDSDEER